MLERTAIQEALQLSNRQLIHLQKLKSVVADIRKKLSLLLSGTQENTKSQTRESVNDLAQQIEVELRLVLNEAQCRRLAQLEAHILLARYGGEFVRALATGTGTDGWGDEDQRMELRNASDELKKLGREVDALAAGLSSEELITKWLEGFADPEVVRNIFREAKIYEVILDPFVEWFAMQSLDESVERIDSKKTIIDIWGTTSVIKVSPTGVVTSEQTETREASVKYLLANIALNEAFSHAMELTREQQNAAVAVLKSAKDDTRIDLAAELREILLPHQMEYLEQRAVWREVETFGFAPCVIGGRIGKILSLTPSQTDELKKRASELVAQINQQSTENHRKQIELITSELNRLGLDGLAEHMFGEPVDQAILMEIR